MVSVQIDSTTGSELVSTSEIKSYARIETSSDDTLIGILNTSARSACEDYINRDIVAKTRTYFRSHVPEKVEIMMVCMRIDIKYYYLMHL